MQDDFARAQQLQNEVSDSIKKLDITGLRSRLDGLRKTTEAADFWQDHQKADATMREIAKLEGRIVPWEKLQATIDDAVSLLETNDETMHHELNKQVDDLTQRFEQLKQALRFAGPYDSYDALVTIHAGAGGTDAQDWANMLLRMYSRWAEKHQFRVVTDEESVGDEAGIKSATIEISGDSVFGRLKGEHGVHRLVRLSPYNANNLRQTSFAKIEVLPKVDKPEEVTIDEKDLRIDVYRSGGHGGQSVNTTDSAVRITHLPTGITIAIQNERSQLHNKETALTILRSKLAQLQIEQHTEKISELKGPNEQAAWGNQIRSYVMHPYKQVKDLRTRYETTNIEKVLDGDLDDFINAYLEYTLEA